MLEIGKKLLRTMIPINILSTGQIDFRKSAIKIRSLYFWNILRSRVEIISINNIINRRLPEIAYARVTLCTLYIHPMYTCTSETRHVIYEDGRSTGDDDDGILVRVYFQKPT